MSTRAIIALPVMGGFETAWCWNDGGPANLGAELRRYFTTEKDVRQLIDEHSFSTILGPRHIEECMNKGDTAVAIPVNASSSLRFALKHPHDGSVVEGKGKYGFFKSISDMLECDLNYVYVFENGKWKTYK